MNLFFYMALAPYDFDAGKRHLAGHWAMKVETFLGSETARAKQELLEPKKIDRFIGNFMQMRTELFQGPNTHSRVLRPKAGHKVHFTPRIYFMPR